MTFPSGGPGYPQQGGAQPHQPAPNTGGFPPQAPPHQAAAAENPLNLGLLLALAVAVLGLVQYFIGFSDEANRAGQVSIYLLVGGLLAGLRALPKGPKTLPFAALFSVLGAFQALDLVISTPADSSTPGIITVILILGILQMLVAVAALLFDHDVIKLPAPKPAVPQNPYGQPYGQQFGHQPPQFQQGPPQQQHQPPTGAQPQQPSSGPQGTQFNPPVAPPAGPGSGATTYAPQQGQFFSSEPTQSTPPPSSPGTPPGGFGEPK